MANQPDIILRGALVEASSPTEGIPLRPGGEGSALGQSYIEDSDFELAGIGELHVDAGEIKFGDDSAPQLVVRLGKLQGDVIEGKTFDLPRSVEISRGRLVPAAPALAFPEGQTDAKELPGWLNRLLYGRGAERVR